MRISVLAVAVLVGLTVQACATTVPGEGRPAALDSSRSGQPSGTGDPSDSTEPTQTSAPTGTTDGDLDCPEQSVSPAGAPYCYTAPAGLDAVELGDPTAGNAGSFRTSYGFGPTDHVEVQAYVVGIDTDELTDDEIIAELAGVVVDLEAGGFDFDEQPTSLLVDDARAFVYRGTSTDSSQAIITHFVFRGGNEVQVNCASVDRAEVIDTACADVLASLQIVG